MFEKLFSKIKEPAIEIISQHPSIPTDKKAEVADDAIASISEEIERMMNSGDFSHLSGINKENNPETNPSIQNIITSFSKKLQEKTAIVKLEADQLSKEIIPSLFVKAKEQFSGEGVDLKSLMSSLSLSDMMKLMANMSKLKAVFGK